MRLRRPFLGLTCSQNRQAEMSGRCSARRQRHNLQPLRRLSSGAEFAIEVRACKPWALQWAYPTTWPWEDHQLAWQCQWLEGNRRNPKPVASGFRVLANPPTDVARPIWRIPFSRSFS
jgi:hypothetical protein